jgi:hypothetical protein
MLTNVPTQKVQAGGVASAASFLLVWGLNKYAHADIDAEAAIAINGLFVFLVQYLTPPAPRDVAVGGS